MTASHPPKDMAYSEVHQFRQPWILILVGGIAGIAWYSFIRQVIVGDPFGSNPVSDTGVIVILVIFGIIFPVWFLVMQLGIQISSVSLRFRMFPLYLKWREVPFGIIAGVMAVVYQPSP
jgi:hypothetical protein